MKRRLLILAVFLLAGAIVNVAVAWGCAATINIHEGSRPSYSAPMENGSVSSVHATGAVVVSTHRDDYALPFVFDTIMLPPGKFGRRIAPAWAFDALKAFGRETIPERLAVDGRGWPMIALWSTHTWSPYQPQGAGHRYEGNLRIELPPFPGYPRVLPIRPAVIGFSLNTMFYAVVLWLLILGPLFVLRRMVRVRRGLCPKCAYPRGESDVCTECGKALPVRARVTAT
jgi:hypothetical protein